jgi:hypothetical protein
MPCCPQSHAVQEALTANVLREHNCYTEFGIFFFKKVLTLVQNAKCWLHAYPYYPDRMAMASLLAAEAGLAKAGSAAVMMKQESQQLSQPAAPAVQAAPVDVATAAAAAAAAGLSWLPTGFVV